jgi:hypothetical protein
MESHTRRSTRGCPRLVYRHLHLIDRSRVPSSLQSACWVSAAFCPLKPRPGPPVRSPSAQWRLPPPIVCRPPAADAALRPSINSRASPASSCHPPCSSSLAAHSLRVTASHHITLPRGRLFPSELHE